MQSEIINFKEITVDYINRLQQASSRVCDITNPDVYINPAPRNMKLPVMVRGCNVSGQRALGG